MALAGATPSASVREADTELDKRGEGESFALLIPDGNPDAEIDGGAESDAEGDAVSDDEMDADSEGVHEPERDVEGDAGDDADADGDSLDVRVVDEQRVWVDSGVKVKHADDKGHTEDDAVDDMEID